MMSAKKIIQESELPNGCVFIDAQREHRAHPDTFAKPPDSDLAAVEPGCYVKIGVRFSRRYNSETGDLNVPAGTPMTGERFWVMVKKVLAPNIFVGVVDNILICPNAHGLHLKDRVQFQSQHLLMVVTKKEVEEQKARRKQYGKTQVSN